VITYHILCINILITENHNQLLNCR